MKKINEYALGYIWGTVALLGVTIAWALIAHYAEEIVGAHFAPAIKFGAWPIVVACTGILVERLYEIRKMLKNKPPHPVAFFKE